ncbi:hypothetical protein EUGRSUZ_C04401 [Eucalyptus grandis]|uniref:Uncharacterized protein n=2 Tax=Eucalyptus grandis TaxID=71139 RepID=A0ACC3LL11_EUCGR|nr:hypothetical protein EUGRSUZ_C04401 [Eucalyptus grandis]
MDPLITIADRYASSSASENGERRGGSPKSAIRSGQNRLRQSRNNRRSVDSLGRRKDLKWRSPTEVAHITKFPPPRAAFPVCRLHFEAAASRHRVDGAGPSRRSRLALRGDLSGSNARRIGHVRDRARFDALGSPFWFPSFLRGGNGVRSVGVGSGDPVLRRLRGGTTWPLRWLLYRSSEEKKKISFEIEGVPL